MERFWPHTNQKKWTVGLVCCPEGDFAQSPSTYNNMVWTEWNINVSEALIHSHHISSLQFRRRSLPWDQVDRFGRSSINLISWDRVKLGMQKTCFQNNKFFFSCYWYGKLTSFPISYSAGLDHASIRIIYLVPIVGISSRTAAGKCKNRSDAVMHLLYPLWPEKSFLDDKDRLRN